MLIRTVGPAIKEVPESAIAAQPPAQNPREKRQIQVQIQQLIGHLQVNSS